MWKPLFKEHHRCGRMSLNPEAAEIDAPPVPATPKPHFLIPPATEEERPKLKRNFFDNWVDPADWKESDLARINPEAREEYERFLVRDRPKYIPMKPEQGPFV